MRQPAFIVARNAGMTAVAISRDQSLQSDANPMPKTVRLSQRDGPLGVAGWLEWK